MDPLLLSAPIEPLPGESRREAERRTVRALLSDHYGRSVGLGHTPAGAPYIPGSGDCISISHCCDQAVVAIAPRPIGVDVETWREQLLRVAPHFLSESELLWAGDDPERLLCAWTTKEAIYKLIGQPGTALRDIPLHPDGIAVIHHVSSPRRVLTLAWYSDEL